MSVLERITSEDAIALEDKYGAHNYHPLPVVLGRGEGVHVWDVEGNQYLDFFAGILTTIVGHNHPKVVERAREQMGKIIHSSTLYPNENHVALAEKIAEISPGALNTSYFHNSGSEANEAAVLLAQIYTGNREIIGLRHGYSGKTQLAMSLTAQASWRIGPADGLRYLLGPDGQVLIRASASPDEDP
mgnify:CR=1 FL=1